MQVTETLSEGLKREFKVVVPATELDDKVNQRLGELKDRVRINGFRPGKVPVEHLKRVYGRAVRAETLEATVQEANAKIVADNGLRIAGEPKITFPAEEGEVKEVIDGRSDFTYTVALEILPKIEIADLRSIELERWVAEVTDAEVDEGISRIAEQNRPFGAKAEGATAEKGDRVTISFTGTIDDKSFEGGSAEDIAVNIGSGTFLPGFEDQLIGMGVGETCTVNITFPKNYTAEHLAGKGAVFAVTAKSLETPGSVTVDDAFAKSLGMESLAKLWEAVKERLQREHANVSRQRLKRALLDELDRRHQLELPPSMVEEEFNNIWRSITADLESAGRTLEDEGTTEEKAKADYRTIAARRVRLGLVLAEIGEKNNIKVTDEEVSRAVVERARQFPGQEQQVWDHYRKNAGAMASLRAPIFEEKVVDFIVELAKVTEKQVPREELYKEDSDASPTA